MLVYEYRESHAFNDEASDKGRRNYGSRRDSGADNGQAVVCRDFELEVSLPGSHPWTDAGIYTFVLSRRVCMETGLLRISALSCDIW